MALVEYRASLRSGAPQGHLQVEGAGPGAIGPPKLPGQAVVIPQGEERDPAVAVQTEEVSRERPQPLRAAPRTVRGPELLKPRRFLEPVRSQEEHGPLAQRDDLVRDQLAAVATRLDVPHQHGRRRTSPEGEGRPGQE